MQQFVDNKMNIALWGAGEFGKYVIDQLKQNVQVHVWCVIDNHVRQRDIAGIEIVSPEEYMEKYDMKIDFVLVTFLDGISICGQLTELRIAEWGVVNNFVFQKRLELNLNLKEEKNILWNYDREISLSFMDILETNVVDYCNLNCKGCSHFSNIFEKGAQIPYEIFERDIRYLSKKVYISQFNLLGGEIFLSTKLMDYINCLEKYMPKTYIILVTNGLLIPRLEKGLLTELSQHQVEIEITEYLPTLKMKEQIVETLERYHIRYLFREGIMTFGKNIDLSGKNDPREAQLLCRESTCQFLRNGKIYKCPFSALGNYFFDYYSIPLHFEEGIDIYKEGVDWEKLPHNLRNISIELCKYCGTEERFDWAVSTHPQKEEWLI